MCHLRTLTIVFFCSKVNHFFSARNQPQSKALLVFVRVVFILISGLWTDTQTVPKTRDVPEPSWQK